MSCLTFNRSWMLASSLMISILTFSACSPAPVTDSLPTALPTDSPSETATPESIPEELTIQQEIDYGPGPFIYTDTKTGLSELPSYQAVLTLTFDGTRDGQPQKWSKTYTMLVTKDPQARQLTIERTSDSSNLEPVFLAEMNGMAYERRGENTCQGTPIREENSLGERLEPASFLTYVIGAEEAGSESINGVTANHYTFDQHALGEQDLTEATGELWVASEGNFIVKYLLTRKGKSDYFGEGTEGTLTLDYQLADPNQLVTIQLPEDCPPGMVDAPLLPDASSVQNLPGALSYTTSTSLAEAAAFYQEEIPKLGWTPEGVADISESAALLTYKKGKQNITVVVTITDSVTTVHIFLENAQE
jgi:hypothetical protein